MEKLNSFGLWGKNLGQSKKGEIKGRQMRLDLEMKCEQGHL